MTERETLLAEIAEKQARLAELDAPDPLLVEAREICAKRSETIAAHHHARGYRNGEYDGYQAMVTALAALRRGMELAECPTLTREMVREAVEIADVQAMGVKEYVDTLHAALVERIRAFQTGEQP